MTEQVKTGNQAGALLGMGTLAETYLRVGDLRRASDAVAVGLTLSEQSGTRLWDSELQRLQGEILLRAQPADEASALECFQRSLETVHAHGMQTLELRTALRLARRHRERGEIAEASSLLEPRCRAFAADAHCPIASRPEPFLRQPTDASSRPARGAPMSRLSARRFFAADLRRLGRPCVRCGTAAAARKRIRQAHPEGAELGLEDTQGILVHEPGLAGRPLPLVRRARGGEQHRALRAQGAHGGAGLHRAPQEQGEP